MSERQPKAACQHCGCWDSRVMQGWSHPDGYVRRRKCLKCGKTFRTIEQTAADTSIDVSGDPKKFRHYNI